MHVILTVKLLDTAQLARNPVQSWNDDYVSWLVHCSQKEADYITV